MTTILNPLNCKDIGPYAYYWFLLGTRNRIHYRTFLLELQKAAIREVSGKRNGKEKRPRNRFLQNTAVREDPGSFREEKREGETADRFFQITAIREVSGKRNGKGETDYQKTRSPGRSGKIPGRFPGRDVSTVSPVCVPFPSGSPAPDFPNPDHVSISWSKVAKPAKMCEL